MHFKPGTSPGCKWNDWSSAQQLPPSCHLAIVSAWWFPQQLLQHQRKHSWSEPQRRLYHELIAELSLWRPPLFRLLEDLQHGRQATFACQLALFLNDWPPTELSATKVPTPTPNGPGPATASGTRASKESLRCNKHRPLVVATVALVGANNKGKEAPATMLLDARLPEPSEICGRLAAL